MARVRLSSCRKKCFQKKRKFYYQQCSNTQLMVIMVLIFFFFFLKILFQQVRSAKINQIIHLVSMACLRNTMRATANCGGLLCTCNLVSWNLRRRCSCRLVAVACDTCHWPTCNLARKKTFC